MMMEQYLELFKAYEDSIKGDTKTGRVNMGTMVWSGRNRTWLDVHKKEDAFLIMCHNSPFLEVFPNHFIVIAPPPDSIHYTNQMNIILNAIIPKAKKRTRHYYITRRFNDRMAMRICSFGQWNKRLRFVDHCIVNEEGEMIYSDFDKAIVDIDKKKTLAFKRKIRNYFKPYEVLIRIQSVEDEIKRLSLRPHHENLQDLVTRLGITDSPVEHLLTDRTKDAINKHIDSDTTMTTEFTTLITLAGLPYMGRYIDHKQFHTRINKVKAALRLRFSQICTKVMYDKYIPEEAYAKYQSMVIQQINGLRSLPVPSQAEVSRSYPGAVSPTSNREA